MWWWLYAKYYMNPLKSQNYFYFETERRHKGRSFDPFAKKKIVWSIREKKCRLIADRVDWPVVACQAATRRRLAHLGTTRDGQVCGPRLLESEMCWGVIRSADQTRGIFLDHAWQWERREARVQLTCILAEIAVFFFNKNLSWNL